MGSVTDIFSVFLVEDNADDEELACWALKKVGITRVTVARDGAEAIDKLINSNPTSLPDLVLLDLRLPKIDGIDVLKQLRAAEPTRHLKVIALTSSEDPQDKEACRQLGVAAFFSKPLNEKTLLSYL